MEREYAEALLKQKNIEIEIWLLKKEILKIELEQKRNQHIDPLKEVMAERAKLGPLSIKIKLACGADENTPSVNEARDNCVKSVIELYKAQAAVVAKAYKAITDAGLPALIQVCGHPPHSTIVVCNKEVEKLNSIARLLKDLPNI